MAIPGKHLLQTLAFIILWTCRTTKAYMSVCEDAHIGSVYCSCDEYSYRQPSSYFKVDCVILTNISQYDSVWRSLGDADNISHLKIHPRLPVKLHYIPSDDFRRMSHLKVLKFQEGSLGKLTSYSISEFNALEELELQGNEITAMEPNAFSNMPKLKKLTLSDNSLQELLADTMNGLLALEALFLDNNNISRIEPCAFCDLHNLKELELVNNQISDLTEYTFRGLRYLKRLDLYINKIRILNDKVFHNLERLVELDLRDNLISHISARAFVGLKMLQRLALSNNNIKVLPNEVFAPLMSVRNVDLYYNEIEVIQKEIVDSMKISMDEHFTMAFSANPLTCDCAWQWITSYIKQNHSRRFTQELQKAKCKPENATIVDYLKGVDCKGSSIKVRTPVIVPNMIVKSTVSAPFELHSQKSKPLMATPATTADDNEPETFLNDVGKEASVDGSNAVKFQPYLMLYLVLVVACFQKLGIQL